MHAVRMILERGGKGNGAGEEIEALEDFYFI